MDFGIDLLLKNKDLRKALAGKRVALLGHPASVCKDLTHTLDALCALDDIKVTAAFGPQHGMRGDKQDNMKESHDFTDPIHGIPIYSLYGEWRRPTEEMMKSHDVLLVDLQDLGCRIYTFITTLRYVLEAAAKAGTAVWVLDRPNPIGRNVEGLTLREGWQSFVGAGKMPMRHGLTMAELGQFFIKTLGLNVEYKTILMEGWKPNDAPGYGWHGSERAWVNPSPNAPNLYMARAYPGSVMVEGTTLSEGRGTTRPLEVFGAPDINARDVIAKMRQLAPQWMNGCILRDFWFEPTFNKHVGKLCSGIHVHTDLPNYDHATFRPWRLQALAFKAIRTLYPDYPLWRDFHYEYELDKLAIDVINGSPLLREWVDNPSAVAEDLDVITKKDEKEWEETRREFLLY